ncbi:MAG TPA: GNAT family N-acetyltransferase [Solirubrobacteraceae bacterium]
MAPELSFREGTAHDAAVMAETVGIGFDTYRAFAPPAWEPPRFAVEVAGIRSRMAGDDAWAFVAFDGGEPAGHIALLADPAPGTVYLWQLFVRPAYWGTGLADDLHAAFLAEARARGYARGRLKTPFGQERARRFYERNGWQTDGLATFDDTLGLELLVYTRAGLT